MSDGYPPNYYAGLSNLKFQPIMPLSGLITGIEAGQQMEQTALRNAVVRQGMEQAKVEEGRKTALFPEQLNEAQVKTALDISKYADEVLPRTTYESYPSVRSDVLKKFPSLSTHFPDPGQFKSAADFDNWKTAAWRLQAQLKALPQIITAASREKVSQQRSEDARYSADKRYEGSVLRSNATRYSADQRGTTGGNKGSRGRIPGYGEWSADNPGKTVADYNREIVSPHYKAVEEGKRQGKGERYDESATNKAVSDSIIKDLSFPESPLSKKLKGLSGAEYDKAVAAEKTARRKIYGVGKGGNENDTVPPAQKPSASVNKEKYWTTEDGRIFQSDGANWNYIKSVK